MKVARRRSSTLTSAGHHPTVASDAHAPARFRVAGTVANTPEFAQAFQCKAGTPLNPANRCKIW
ncbi:endothelin converting enzyme-1 [Fimicolochytrium jonesii]|uniref:endothelin converting enzyme-1 n=1 Tax=Fimicolochytrium jonesii TaxID=1396493 RepID=UPI0022FDDCBA|nr:endothelin converting enzyme-1 [Fimicolochytrium jonesii]KAI8818276.1 endothelin converting enzyme-1 [Fimicolochytrium jonesii]